MKKKYITTLLFTFLLICCVMLFADDKSTNIRYTVDSNYSWEIHTDIDFGADKGTYKYLNETAVLGDNTQAGVRVNSNVIPDGTTLNISLTNDNTFTVVNGSTSLGYSVAKTNGGSALSAGDLVLSVESGVNTGSQPLYFTLATTHDTAEIAGTYIGEVNYVAEIVPMSTMHTVTLDMQGRGDNITLTCLDGEYVTLPEKTSQMYTLAGLYGGVSSSMIEYSNGIYNEGDDVVYIYDYDTQTASRGLFDTDLPNFSFTLYKSSQYDVSGYSLSEGDYIDYYTGDSYYPTGDETLYAVWEENQDSRDIRFADEGINDSQIDESTWNALSYSYYAPEVEVPLCIYQTTNTGYRCVLVTEYEYELHGPNGYDINLGNSNSDFYNALTDYNFLDSIDESSNYVINLVISGLSPED